MGQRTLKCNVPYGNIVLLPLDSDFVWNWPVNCAVDCGFKQVVNP